MVITRGRRITLLGGLWGAVALCVLTRGAVAEEPPFVIWYRTTTGCPDGSAFIARLAERGKAARVATAGDRVDFVVSLEFGDPKSHGRLERQTSEGIVAIREVEGQSCDEVADALALTLALAADAPSLSPAQKPAAVAPPSSVAAPKPTTSDTRPQSTAEQAPVNLNGPPGADIPPDEAALADSRSEGPLVGVVASGRTAIAPRGAFGGLLFAARDTGGWLDGRLSVGALYGNSDNERGGLEVVVMFGRLEACPVSFGGARVSSTWCAGAELGSLRAKGGGVTGVDDRDLWAAGTIDQQLRWPASARWGLLLDFGIFVPFTRYEVVAENPSQKLHSMPAAGVTVGLGVSFRSE